MNQRGCCGESLSDQHNGPRATASAGHQCSDDTRGSATQPGGPRPGKRPRPHPTVTPATPSGLPGHWRGHLVAVVGPLGDNSRGRPLRDQGRGMRDGTGTALVALAAPREVASPRGYPAYDQKESGMETGDQTTGKRVRWIGISVLLAALLVASATPSAAWG